MRDAIGRRTCVTILLGCACTPTRSEPSAELIEAAPVFADAALPASSPDPSRIVRPPGCPVLRTFADAEQLCTRGIEPLHPYGACRSVSQPQDSPRFSGHDAPIAGLGGTAELFVTEFVGSGETTNETVYLALRGSYGYVLLADVGHHHSQANELPKLKRLDGTPTSVTLETIQEWYLEEDTEIRRTNTSCTYDDDRGLRCNEACPAVAVDEPLPALDCTALSRFDWASLRWEDTGNRYGGIMLEVHYRRAMDYLGAHGHESVAARSRKRFDEYGLDSTAVMNSVGLPRRQSVDIYQLHAGPSVLMHGAVPLLASEREIFVGEAPGGWFVTYFESLERRVLRINIATHELEPVFPGECGSTPTP
jgi:hypothetical protein